MRTVSLSVLALLTTGCASGIDGIWTMQISYPAEDTCTESLVHNVTGAFQLEGDDTGTDDGWTSTTSETHTDQLTFVQVETTGKDTAILVIGNETWPGIKNAKGNYTFNWSGEDAVLDDSSHTSGYSYSYSQSALSEETLSLVLDAGIGSGVWEASTSNEQAWLETDLWSEEVRFQAGQIPVGDYLLITDQTGPKPEEVAASNSRDAVDCDGDNCSLSVTSSCEGSLDVILKQTDFDDEDSYNYLRNSGQGYGAS